MISNISNINSHRMTQIYRYNVYIQVYHLSTKIANLHIHRESLRYLIFWPLTFSKQLPFSERRAVPETCLIFASWCWLALQPPLTEKWRTWIQCKIQGRLDSIAISGIQFNWKHLSDVSLTWGGKGLFFRLGFATWPCQNHRSIPIAAWLLMHHGRMTCSTANGGSRLCLTFKKTWRWSDKWMLRCVDS